jgi:hypothetical protein
MLAPNRETSSRDAWLVPCAAVSGKLDSLLSESSVEQCEIHVTVLCIPPWLGTLGVIERGIGTHDGHHKRCWPAHIRQIFKATIQPMDQ